MQSKEIKGIQEAYASIYESAPTSPADAVKKVNKKNFPAPKPLEESDIFDIIKGHLIDEGFAETEEAALAIMSNMSEEWRQSIVEGPALQNTIKTLETRRDQMDKNSPGSSNLSSGGKQSVGAALSKAYQRGRV